MLLSVSTATPKTPRRWPPAEALVFSRTVAGFSMRSRGCGWFGAWLSGGQLPHFKVARDARYWTVGRCVGCFGCGTLVCDNGI